MGAKKIKYNLSGHGQLILFRYPYAESLYNILCKHNYDAKFNKTNQLGALKRVLPGAHYTRHEYILLQWYLIHELGNRSKDTGLKSNGSFLQTLIGQELKDKIGSLSGGDFLQCLAILTNMGHFPDTFSASRVWLHLLKSKSKSVDLGMKRGLANRIEKDILYNVLESNNIYKIHHLNALFMLNRLSNSSEDKTIIETVKKFYIYYLKRNEEELEKYFKIFEHIRRLSYLIIDSSYAPIPLSLDLASIVSNLELLFGKHINSNSPLISALSQLDNVMQDSVYLASNSLLATAARSSEIEELFQRNTEVVMLIDGTQNNVELSKLSNIRDLLEPIHKKSNSLTRIFNVYDDYETPEIKWDIDNCLDIKFSGINNYLHNFNSDYFAWEKELHSKCGITACSVAVFGNPSNEQLRLVYSRNKTRSSKMQMNSLCKFTCEVLSLREKLEKLDYLNENDTENIKKILEYYLKSIFGWDNEVTFEWHNIKDTLMKPFFIGRGSCSVSKRIKEYIELAKKTKISSDAINEFLCTQKMLTSISYRGVVIAYIGATKVWGKDGKLIAEFDGLVIYPYDYEKSKITIVEAKNMPNGNTIASTQLKDRMKYLQQDFDYSLYDIERKGAYVNIIHKKEL